MGPSRGHRDFRRADLAGAAFRIDALKEVDSDSSTMRLTRYTCGNDRISPNTKMQRKSVEEIPLCLL
jgi:hypothetical protein